MKTLKIIGFILFVVALLFSLPFCSFHRDIKIEEMQRNKTVEIIQQYNILDWDIIFCKDNVCKAFDKKKNICKEFFYYPKTDCLEHWKKCE